MKKEVDGFRTQDVLVTWFLGIAAFAIISCSSPTISSIEQPINAEPITPVTIIHIPEMEHYEGFATLERIIIAGSGTPEEFTEVLTHEFGHLEQIEEAGGTVPFWTEYLTNPLQACEWEKAAGAPNHQACNALEQNIALR